MGCSNSKYLGSFILPKYYFNLNINKYNTIDSLSKNFVDNCTKFRNNKGKKIQIPKEFPIFMSLEKEKLVKFITNTPIAKFLENNNNELVIKLNLKSKSIHLNTLSSILREHLDFKNIILVFNFKKNSLMLSHLFYNDELIDDDDTIWSSLIRSAYTELTLIMLIEYSICNLQIANILCNSNKYFYWLKMGNYISKNKIKEIKYLFSSDIIFKQKLESNPRFLKYVKDFDFKFYYNLDNINVKWINQTKKYIEEVKDFNIPESKIMLEILFLINKVYNLNPYKFSNIFYTDTFYIPIIKKEGMGFLLNNKI
jgi:hypothetical protein